MRWTTGPSSSRKRSRSSRRTKREPSTPGSARWSIACSRGPYACSWRAGSRWTGAGSAWWASSRGPADLEARPLPMTDVVPVRRALISVADKRGLVGLGQELTGHGVSLVSSGSTADALREAGVPVTPVSEVTGQPEMLGGRVKTLHPAIHAGILANRRDPGHVNELIERGIEPFDLVVVNLYPFEETVAGGADPDAIIEQIDIGGPTLVRAAAKNFESVGVVVDPDRYELVLREIADEGGLRRDTRRRLAAEAFDLIARYDRAISDWFADEGAQRAD